jgi:Mn2+/Fe2+ NRAMP family transporter
VTIANVPIAGMLVAASVIGGFGAPTGLVVLVAQDRTVMGAEPIPGRLAIAGWVVAVVGGGFGLLIVI